MILLFLCFCGCSVGLLPPDGPGPSWLNDKMYQNFIGYPCVTLADRNGPIGCTTPPGGVSGNLVAATTRAELDSAVALSSSVFGGPVALLLSPSLISDEVIDVIQTADGIIGAIITDFTGDPANLKPPFFSPAEQIPNKQFGLEPEKRNHVWNPRGNGLIRKYMKKPWFSLGPEDTRVFEETLRNNSLAGKQTGVEFLLQMKTSTDSVTCLRRGWCDPVGGVSVLASRLNMTELASAPEVIAVMASLDSSSLFHTRAPGAVSDISGSVAVLAAALALQPLYNTFTPTRPVVYHWFSAEAWGYCGSKFVVGSVSDQKGPYTSSQLYAILEAKQVGSIGAKLYAHQEANGKNQALLATVQTAASLLNVSVTAFPADASVGLPPSSAMSFLAKWPGVPTLVLTDHAERYANRFYHSQFDDFANVDPQLVCAAASVLAGSIASLQGLSAPVQANCTLVTELLSCLTRDWACPLFAEYIWWMKDAKSLPTAYSGVWGGTDNMPPPSKLFHDMALQQFSATPRQQARNCTRNGECGDVDVFHCVRGRCLEHSRVWYWAAVPGDLLKRQVSTRLSEGAFTESVWNGLGLRLFVRAPPAAQLGALVTGVALALLTLVAVVLARRFS